MDFLFLLIPIAVALSFSITIGKFAEKMGLGFWKFFLISLFFSPFVGGPVLLFVMIKKQKFPVLRNIVQDLMLKNNVHNINIDSLHLDDLNMDIMPPLSPEEIHRQKMEQYSKENK